MEPPLTTVRLPAGRHFRYGESRRLCAEDGGNAVRGASRTRVTAARLSALALAGCLAFAQLSPAAQPSLYDAALYAKASQALAAGDLEGAMRGYCDMLSVRGPGTLWTLSAVLLCDPAE